MEGTGDDADLDALREGVVGLPFFVDSRVRVGVSFFEGGFFSRGFVGMLGDNDGHRAEPETLRADVNLVYGGIDVVLSVPTHAEETGAPEGLDGNMLVGVAGYAAGVGQRGELHAEILVFVLEVRGAARNGPSC